MKKIKSLFFLIASSLIVFWPQLLLAHGDDIGGSSDYMMNGVSGMMGGWNFFGTGFGFMIIFWAIFIGIFIVLVRWIAGRAQESSQSALEILKQRYAKGEIDKQEFEQTKKDLD